MGNPVYYKTEKNLTCGICVKPIVGVLVGPGDRLLGLVHQDVVVADEELSAAENYQIHCT